MTIGAVVVLGLCVYLVQLFKLPARLPAVPQSLTTEAQIPGIPNARYWVGLDIEPLIQAVGHARDRERAYLRSTGHSGTLPPLNLLAISGGGDKGAFGAGLLNGWTASGTRPEFKAVTGVSTGALIAPFAYLGPDYDPVLTAVYTKISPTDIARKRSVIAAIEDDGMADNRPLWALISKYIDQDLLDKIAAEHAKGRLLLIGTTDLDALQPVVWDMGEIAASGAPGAIDLFRSILLASAAIPGAFPPTMIRVEANGQRYEEMHVDGGASAQVFLYPPSMVAEAKKLSADFSRTGTVYVIRNATLHPTYGPVRRQTIGIATRAIASLIQTQGFGDLHRIYLTTQRDGLDFNLAYISADFTYEGKKEQFETAYMQKLYEFAYEQSKTGYQWKKTPPGLE